jgi:hypothetical protein
MAAPDFVGAPLFGLGANLLQDFFYNQRFDQFQQQQIDPFNRALNQSAASLGPIQNITGMSNQLYRKAQGLVGGISDQEVTDVNRRFDQLGASAMAGLNARGIGGSTVAPSVRFGVERGRSDELRRVNDERLMRLLGVESTFGQGQIAANLSAAQTRIGALDRNVLIPPGQPTPIQVQPQFKP